MTTIFSTLRGRFRGRPRAATGRTDAGASGRPPRRGLLRMASSLMITLALLATGAMAQEEGAPAADAEAGTTEEQRVITIDSSGGTQSGDLRYGPIRYEHPEPLGITATVSDLTIRGPQAVLEAPPDTLLSRAKGARTATFDGSVAVSRGRLEALGPGLVYEEATGLGLLSGGVEIEIAPEEEEDDPTFIAAESAEFDVDTDRSISRGSVVLESGTQRAEADVLTYAEARDLGHLECEALCTVVREDEESGTLRITAEEIRVLTGNERLWASGDVTVVDGTVTTTGEEVFYDDEEAIAEVLGSPARSVDESTGDTLESDRIRQDVRYDFVEAIDASLPREATVDAFLFEEEREGEAPASP